MRPCRADISRSALLANLALARSLAGQAKLTAVVKANAYGHGASLCARLLAPASDLLAVASIDEALELRASGIDKPVLLLEGHFEESELRIAVEHNFWLMLHNERQLAEAIAFKPDSKLCVWLKVDTGMHRLGLPPEQVSDAVRALRASKHIDEEIVLASHFACADQCDQEPALAQVKRFDEINQALALPVSLANSPALLSLTGVARDWVRPGIMLYGSSPLEQANRHSEQLQAVMGLHSEVIALREIPPGDGVGYGLAWRADRHSKIATVAAGYGDGYPRHAPNGTPVHVGGQAATLVGRVSMDMICVDVTDCPQVALGTPVELWGTQVSVDEVARQSGTIAYELLTRMPARVPRRLVD